MTSSTFIAHLKLLLPEANWPWVFPALRQDANIWEMLCGEFGRFVIARGSTDMKAYSPAILSMLALGYAVDFDRLSEGTQPVDESETPLPETQSAFADTYLAQAGRAALDLYQRRPQMGSWRSVSPELANVSPTILACLFGMLEDGVEMLRVVALNGARGSAPAPGMRLALHALLSNPLPPDEQQSALAALAGVLPAAQQTDFLQQAFALRPDLVPALAGSLIEARLITTPSAHPLQCDPLKDLDSVARQMQFAEMHRLAEQPAQAEAMLNQSILTAQRLQAHLYALCAQAAEQGGDHQAALNAWENAVHLDPDFPGHAAGLALALLDSGRSADAQEILSTHAEETLHAELLFARARLAGFRGNLVNASQYASEAVSLLAVEPERIKITDWPLLSQMARLLLELNMPGEASQIAELALACCPNQAEVLDLSARASLAAHRPAQSVETAHMAVALAPARLDLRQHLAESLEAAADWQAALQERTYLVEHLPEPSPTDLRALAACALQAGYPERTRQICQQLIDMDGNDGLAFALLGESMARMGELQQGYEYLSRAVDLAPDHAVPWLAMARLSDLLGQPQKSVETLQAAVLAAPDFPQVHLALGEAFLAQGSPTQALGPLRHASELLLEANPASYAPLYWLNVSAPISRVDQAENGLQGPAPIPQRGLADQVALRYGQTLQQLGHNQQACLVLEEAYQRRPDDPELARCYAQALLAQGETSAALQPLEAVLASQPKDLDPYLDYARSILVLPPGERGKRTPASILPVIRTALELAPNHAEATALLAEALAANQEYLPAMDAYQKALESELAQDMAWQARLSMGLGHVAHKLGQIETAVAALQEASQADPTDARIQRKLSEAYDSAGLAAEALQAASLALKLSPSDPENLSWFANQAITLKDRPGINAAEVQSEAVAALERATQITPERADLWVTLGHTRVKMGNHTGALVAFNRLASDVPSSILATSADLYSAAQGLLRLNNPEGAVRCLELAMQSSHPVPDDSGPGLLELLATLADARFKSGDYPAALEALNQAILMDPDQPAHHLHKANLLLAIGRDQSGSAATHGEEISACLQTALSLSPGDPQAFQQAALILQAAGRLTEALGYAVQMIHLTASTVTAHLSARTLAADLTLAMLQPESTRAYLDFQPSTSPRGSLTDPADQSAWVDFYALRAELALEARQERSAVDELVKVLEVTPEHPRIMALQACLTHRRNDLQTANRLFQSALESIGDGARASYATQRTLAKAAAELNHWNAAVEIWKRMVEALPLEPRSHIGLASALAMRAENQRLCHALDIVQHAPGSAALGASNMELFLDALQKTEIGINDLLSRPKSPHTQPNQEAQERHLVPEFTPRPEQAYKLLRRWRARGLAAFQPTPEHADLLVEFSSNPEDVAARVAILRELGDLTAAGLAARDYPQNPMILIHLALALAQDKPRQAMAAIHAAADALVQIEKDHPTGASIATKDLAPMVNLLIARLFHNNGNRAGDRQSALQSIQSALTMWPDEPRWHILAAEIHLHPNQLDGQMNTQAAASHLQNAIQLEPDYAPPYLTLGQIYLKDGAIHPAIQILEQAVQLQADEAEPWIWLAQAYLAQGELDQAASSAERAVSLAPNQAQPLLLRGEIALQANNPRGAQSRSEAALRIHPDDPAALLLQARALSALDQPDQAMSVLEKALPLASNPLPLSLERVRLLRLSRGTEAALQAIQELAEYYPENPTVMTTLAELMESAGKGEEAIRAAQRALRCQGLDTMLPMLQQANLHYLLGRLLRRSGQLDQAVHHLSEAIRLAPELIEVYLELGHTHLERRQHSLALSAYRQAIAAAPDDHRAYYMMGQALKESKDYMNAEKMLRRAAELAPNDLSIHRLLAAVVALNLVHNRREVSREPLGR